jgi:hypothetical protein
MGLEGLKKLLAEAMEDDPFMDDLWVVGTTGQHQRCEHYAGIAATLLIERVERLEEALDLTMVGGNHLATVLIGKLGAGFAEEFPPDLDQELALRMLCATDTYDVWCCWSAIMRARSVLSTREGECGH